MARWIVAALCTILLVAGCTPGGREREEPPRVQSVAGCWSVPDERLNADFSAIVLRLYALARPSGDETLRGTLAFVTGPAEEFSVHGTHEVGAAYVQLISETFEAKGTVAGDRLMMTMVHFDDLETVDLTMERNGKGCQDN